MWKSYTWPFGTYIMGTKIWARKCFLFLAEVDFRTDQKNSHAAGHLFTLISTGKLLIYIAEVKCFAIIIQFLMALYQNCQHTADGIACYLLCATILFWTQIKRIYNSLWLHISLYNVGYRRHLRSRVCEICTIYLQITLTKDNILHLGNHISDTSR